MVAVTHTLPSQPDGSGSIALALFSIQSGCNGGLEAALRMMDQLGVDIGFLLETKFTGEIFTWHLSGYGVLASTATSSSSGGIALFWRGKYSHEVTEMQNWGSNIISIQLVLGATHFFVVGCYIPPL
jgi:hypothetical protein